MGRQTKFPKQKILLKVKRPNRERVLCPPKWRNATSPVTAILLYFWCKCKPRARSSLWRCLCSSVQFLFTIFLVLTQPVTTCTFWCKAGWWRWTFLGRAESSSQRVTVRRCGRHPTSPQAHKPTSLPALVALASPCGQSSPSVTGQPVETTESWPRH